MVRLIVVAVALVASSMLLGAVSMIQLSWLPISTELRSRWNMVAGSSM